MPKNNIRRKAQLGLDVREGGIAIPIAPNMYYMNGRSHNEGGIGIGPNNKNGLEVEGGEVVKVGDKDIKVFSNVPLLRGVSPAQLVMGGANPDNVFKAQEEFKDRNKINDDGTHYQNGGNKIININDLPSSFRGHYRNGKYLQIGIPPVANKANRLDVNFKQKMSALNADMKDFIMDGIKYVNNILPKPLRKYYARGINILNSPGVEGINNAGQKITQVQSIIDEKRCGGIRKFKLGGSNQDDTKTAALKRLKNRFTITGNYGGGLFGGAGAGSVIIAQPEYVNDIITKRYLVPVTQTFNDAFRNARNNNQNEFMFDGKLYNTNLGDNPNNNAAGASRTSTIIVPIEHKEVRRRKKEFGGNMIYTVNGNVKNGLMSARPKAEWGKGSNEKKTKSTDIRYLRTPEGVIFETGHSAINLNGKAILNNEPEFIDIAIRKQSNKRPQYYAKKRLPIAGSQSIAEKAGLARSGWSYADNEPIAFNYVPNINLTIPDDYGKGSTPRRGEIKSTSSKTTSKSTPTLQDSINQITMDAISRSIAPKIDLSKVQMPKFDVSQLSSKETKAAKAKLNTSPTGGSTKPKDGRWIGQYNPVTTNDWIGLGSNVLGSLASYFITKNAINKTPEPVKPIMASAAKLKTRYNIKPQLSEIREAEQMNRAAVRRNTQSSNTSLAREQRLMNEARGARNQLYGQKENIETQLINQDRLNRQSVMKDNIRIYNDYLNRLTATRQNQNQLRVSNINNLISGLTGSVNNILSTIDTRRATNNTLRAIAAANPNVDARLIGGFDYYIDPITKRKYNKNQQYVGTINS